MENKTITKDAIATALTGLADSINKEQVELYKKIIGEDGLCAIFDPETFYFKMIYPFEQFIGGHIRAEISWHEGLIFLLEKSQFVERFFLAEIKKREGLACSADKSGVIIKGLADFFRSGREISWNYDGEYTYHLPKTIFTTHESIVEFFDAVRAIYYGQSDKYIMWLDGNPVNERE